MTKITLCFFGIFLIVLFCCGGKPKEKTKKESHIIELKFEDKSFVFSKIAKPGKVSIFILSTSWCAPCKYLKLAFEDAFRNSTFNGKDLDVYYCSLSGDKYDSFDELDKNKGYINFKEIDQLTAEFPTSYILTPTTNCYSVVSGNYPDSLFRIVKSLIERKKKYFSLENLQWEAADTKGGKTNGKPVDSDSIRYKIDMMLDSIKILNKRLQNR